jgi:hypothetical protein
VVSVPGCPIITFKIQRSTFPFPNSHYSFRPVALPSFHIPRCLFRVGDSHLPIHLFLSTEPLKPPLQKCTDRRRLMRKLYRVCWTLDWTCGICTQAVLLSHPKSNTPHSRFPIRITLFGRLFSLHSVFPVGYSLLPVPTCHSSSAVPLTTNGYRLVSS